MNSLARSLWAAAFACLTIPSSAQPESRNDTRTKVNENVVGIMAGSLGGTDASLAADMGLALSDGYDLRVVPMIGQGSVKDVEDLLYLRGVDMAIVQQDVIDFMANNDVFPEIRSVVRLIAPLSVDQFHVLASKDIKSIYDLGVRRSIMARPTAAPS